MGIVDYQHSASKGETSRQDKNGNYGVPEHKISQHKVERALQSESEVSRVCLREEVCWMGNPKGGSQRTTGDRMCANQEGKSRNGQKNEEGCLGVFGEDQLVESLQFFAIERDAGCVEEAGPKNQPSRGLRDHFRQLRTISS